MGGLVALGSVVSAVLGAAAALLSNAAGSYFCAALTNFVPANSLLEPASKV